MNIEDKTTSHVSQTTEEAANQDTRFCSFKILILLGENWGAELKNIIFLQKKIILETTSYDVIKNGGREGFA